ncbi:hypothetical protein QLX67_13495 [Balneolaceae bacterium ANBcel3]|nr:hypothetical protein [Balneolaceae bacterium ANBcel3]
MLVILFALPAAAQVSAGVDVMSRYIWRGTDFGNSPSIQPEITYTIGGFEVGTWAAIPTLGDPDGYELDWFASYTFETGAGDISLMIADYTFPVPGVGDYFDSDAHYVEAGLAFSNIGQSPFSFFGGIFVHNDDDNSVYLELSYDAEPIGFYLGMTPMESAMYDTSGPAIINVGITAGQSIKITDSFSLDLTYDVIVNPYSEDVFFLIGFSL